MAAVLIKLLSIVILWASITLLVNYLFVRYEVDTSLDLASVLRKLADWIDGK